MIDPHFYDPSSDPPSSPLPLPLPHCGHEGEVTWLAIVVMGQASGQLTVAFLIRSSVAHWFAVLPSALLVWVRILVLESILSCSFFF